MLIGGRRDAARVRRPGFMEHLGTVGTPPCSAGRGLALEDCASLPLPLCVYNGDTGTPSPRGFVRLNESIGASV